MCVINKGQCHWHMIIGKAFLWLWLRCMPKPSSALSIRELRKGWPVCGKNNNCNFLLQDDCNLRLCPPQSLLLLLILYIMNELSFWVAVVTSPPQCAWPTRSQLFCACVSVAVLPSLSCRPSQISRPSHLEHSKNTYFSIIFIENWCSNCQICCGNQWSL